MLVAMITFLMLSSQPIDVFGAEKRKCQKKNDYCDKDGQVCCEDLKCVKYFDDDETNPDGICDYV